MIDKLNNLFNNIELSWIDSVDNIGDSEEFNSLLLSFPNLKEVFQKSREINNDEFQRTIRHIFRSFKIFFLIINGNFSHDTLSQEAITKIQKKVRSKHLENPLLIPILLMYHDIGRYIDNKQHPYHSYQLLSKMSLLEDFELSSIEKLIIRKLVQYHLLMATIYTGESTFYGVYSLLNDSEFIELISSKDALNKFIDLLEVFTYIDILGYVYTKIFDHYIKYYNEINYRLKRILSYLPNKRKTLKKAKEFSQEWLEWRLAGALRIFQFVETKPYLTKEFYYNKLRDSINQNDKLLLKEHTWESLKDQFLIYSYKIQLRYSLAFLMILAFGGFQRMGLKINTGVSPKLILFWALLSKEVHQKSKENIESIWNVYLIGMPHWSEINKSFIKMLNENNIQTLIRNSKEEYNQQKEEYNLYIDFNQLY